MEIADRFCKYFTNIGPNLAKSIPKVNPSFRSYLGDNIRPSINLKPTTTSELESICDMFASEKAPGYDSITMHVIKYSFHLISAPLADIINLSLLKGIFPDKLKIAKIIPIFKAEDVQLLGRIFRKTRYTLPLSVWISEKSLNIARTHLFGK